MCIRTFILCPCTCERISFLAYVCLHVNRRSMKCHTIFHHTSFHVLLHHAIPITFKLDTTLRRMKGRMCEWFPHAMQNVKHRPDLHDKAWRHLRVKKHYVDMIYNEARLRRSELCDEADTAQPSRPQRTTKASTTLLRLQKTFQRTARQHGLA